MVDRAWFPDMGLLYHYRPQGPYQIPQELGDNLLRRQGEKCHTEVVTEASIKTTASCPHGGHIVHCYKLCVFDGVLPTPIRWLDTSPELAALLDTFRDYELLQY